MSRNIYFAKFQSLIRYGLVLWSGEIESVQVKKKYKTRVLHSFKELNKSLLGEFFKELKIFTMTVMCQGVLLHLKTFI